MSLKKIVLGTQGAHGKINVWQSEALTAFLAEHVKDVNVVYSKDFGYAPMENGVPNWDKAYMIKYADRLDPKAHSNPDTSTARVVEMSPLAEAYVKSLGLTPIEAVRKERSELKKLEAKKLAR
jgi:hypothetical protein